MRSKKIEHTAQSKKKNSSKKGKGHRNNYNMSGSS